MLACDAAAVAAVVLRRLDSVLEPTKEKVLDVNRTCRHKNKVPYLKAATATEDSPAGYNFYNISAFTLGDAADDEVEIKVNEE